MWKNVTLNIAFGSFMEMTFESRPSCGKIGPFVGKDETIGPVVRIGPFVGIGQFGGTGPVVSLTYMIGNFGFMLTFFTHLN